MSFWLSCHFGLITQSALKKHTQRKKKQTNKLLRGRKAEKREHQELVRVRSSLIRNRNSATSHTVMEVLV